MSDPVQRGGAVLTLLGLVWAIYLFFLIGEVAATISAIIASLGLVLVAMGDDDD